MLTMKEAERELKPFHETIVEAILIATNEELVMLAFQLKRTLVPANHDQIITAWSLRLRQMCWDEEDDLGVPASLLLQRRLAEEGAVKRNRARQGIELHELQEAMEAFLTTSHNHHLSGNGSMVSWHICLRKQLEELHRLTARALGK